MLKKYLGKCLGLICLFAISCAKDDSITPLNIELSSDTITLTQNSSIDIFVFLNDANIPPSSQFNITNPTKGTAQILDLNNTPNNLLDDIVRYEAYPNETGGDSFEYTICNGTENCETTTVNITITSASTVNFNLAEMPYSTLSEYGFFAGDMKNLEPTFGILPYSLNSKLFSDYAKKKRFVWLPNNTRASYVNDDTHLEFPVGAILIKNFYYENVLPDNDTKIIETRLMIKKAEGWDFANYVWNDEQSEAFFDLNGSTVNIEWLENGTTNSVDYRIPSGAKCFTCHKIMEIAEPIGPKPRNLNRDYNYDDGLKNQLNKWVEFGYLDDALPALVSTLPDYSDESQPIEMRVRAYLDINCAHCHSEETHCAYRPLRLDFSDTNNYTNMGVCVDPDTDLEEGLGHIIEPGDARQSVLHYRISSIDPSLRMPLLGRTLMHTEGIALIEEWIDSLNTECN
ncbi:SO2930 family diheme c-type cytochrome [Winogradskyella aurantia]|uniref:Repeat protein (TIGR03806 family) n=1 Tax=Winogradskyella aurantia TaxID=1915063 RepID=A0A265V086_9FLAO|nr:SO2930 family diheme c-type cytochrome [Winogradskyella aurantia]OZV70902.1 hypothetical protein CA834_01950 [Winogradskyella aurantia]